MEILMDILKILDTEMETPEMYGWFHVLWLVLTAVGTVLLCRFCKGSERKTVLAIALTVVFLEVYKQINYSFTYSEAGISFDYQWYAFPWQFCSTPMYVGLMAGLTRKGKLHEYCCAYLATYAVFAGICVMAYPSTVFVGTIGINIQTMICHGSMIAVGVYLLYTGYVKREGKTVWKALPVFTVMIGIAMVMNEIAFQTGLLEREDFNMFYISPHCEPFLPVYSAVQEAVPYPFCLVLYIAGFTAAAFIILFVAILLDRRTRKPVTQ